MPSEQQSRNTPNSQAESAESSRPEVDDITEPELQHSKSDQDLKIHDSVTSEKLQWETRSMGPPALPASKMKQQPQHNSPSTQQPDNVKGSTPEEVELNTKPTVDEIVSEESQQDSQRPYTRGVTDSQEVPSSDDVEDELGDFDWTDLQVRYHERMAELNAQEHTLSQEYRRLCDVRRSSPFIMIQKLTSSQYFGVWAGTGTGHEVNRSHKRYGNWFYPVPCIIN